MNLEHTPGDLRPTVPRRVLVVADDRDLSCGLFGLLESREYQVVRARDVPEALERTRGEDVPVALIENVPRHDGDSGMIARLKDEHPGIACVSMNGGGAGDPTGAGAEWAYDRLRRPGDARELLPVLDRCFERASLRREKECAAAELNRRSLELSNLDARLKAMVDSARTFAACQEFKNLSRLELVATLEPGMAPAMIPFPLRTWTSDRSWCPSGRAASPPSAILQVTFPGTCRSTATSPGKCRSRRGSRRRRSWRPSGRWPAASPTISITS
jgi:FixJ family two-component response regulator